MSRSSSSTIELTGNRELHRRTPLFDALASLALLSLLCAIGFGRPQLIALGAPALAAVVWALALRSPVTGTVTVGYQAASIVEGSGFDLFVEIVAGDHALDRVEVELVVSDHLVAEGTLRAVTRIDAGASRRLVFPVRAVSWGVGRVEQVSLRFTDRLGMFGGAIDRSTDVHVRVGLPEDRASAALGADRFRRVVGSHLSNDRGEGLEMADIRRWLPGDSMRDINWRITNRRGEPWVTLRHPDRSTTVVVIVDAHDGTGVEQRDAQQRSVAAALALARGHLAMHDPVGLLVVGHTVKWLAPRLGRNHLHRIADELISVGDAPKASLRLYRPPAIYLISKEAIVVAVSPLRDPLMVQLVAELRSRGNPVAVLVPESDAAPRPRVVVERPVTGVARRLAEVEQAAGRHSLAARGVVLVPWTRDEPVTAVMRAVERLRQSMRRGAA